MTPREMDWANQHAGEGLWVADPRTGEVWVSARWREVTGQREEKPGEGRAFPGHQWRELVHPEERDAVAASLEQIAAGVMSEHRSCARVRRGDGGYALVERHCIGVPTDGEGVRILGADRVRQEGPGESPGTAEAGGVLTPAVRGVLDATPLLVWVTGESGQGEFFNQAWLEFRGRTLAEELGDGWKEGVHADDLSGWAASQRKAVGGECGFVREFRLRGRDGKYRWMLDTASVRRDKAGRYGGHMGWCVDHSRWKEQEDRLSQAIEASATAMIMVDPQGRMVLVNAHAERLFGYTRQEMLGESVELLVPEAARGGHPGYRSGFFADPKARPMGAGRDLHGQRKDGRLVPVEIGLSPIETWEGVYVLSSIVDISARKEAERALRESEARLAGVIDSAMDAIITIDSRQRIVLFNTAAEQMFGCAGAEVMGGTLERFIPGRFVKAHAAHIEGFGRTGITSRRMGALGELWARRPDGEEFPIEASISQVECGGERLFTVILRDITSRLKSEAALRESEERYRAVSELASDFAYALRIGADGRGAIEWVTDAFSKITGYTAEELERRGGWRSIVLPEDIVLFEQQMSEIRAGRTDSEEFRIATRDGGIRWIRNRGRPVVDADDGRIMRIVGAAQDVTERREAERRQAVMMAELDHRVKNNLSIVLSMAARTSEGARTMEEFNESFTGRLRALARVHGTLALGRWEGANLRELTSQTLEVHTGKGSEQFMVEGENFVLPAWQAQPMGLVLHELATNAVKYGALSSPQGRVAVRWRVEPGPRGGRELRVRWEESGGPPVTAPTSRGFGTVLIEKGVAYELRGRATLDFRESGVCCEIVTPFTSGGAGRLPSGG